ncbi:isochorismatase family protein [Micromonospora sp. NPDC049559]|uniref:isochorismatase family protein n=1 Tax=Micromonospora sp. NPDC049559 TaxID=3155923 RepID=UPI003438F3ED
MAGVPAVASHAVLSTDSLVPRVASVDRAPPMQRVIAELEAHPDDGVFTRWRHRVFHGSTLLPRIRAADRNQPVQCGPRGQVGVLVTALGTLSNDIQPFVADALGDFPAPEHRLAVGRATGSWPRGIVTRQVRR